MNDNCFSIASLSSSDWVSISDVSSTIFGSAILLLEERFEFLKQLTVSRMDHVMEIDVRQGRRKQFRFHAGTKDGRMERGDVDRDIGMCCLVVG
jgi:hypothetical protein